jgi:hypothetical protein
MQASALSQAVAAAELASVQSVRSGIVGAELSPRKEALRAELAGLQAMEEAGAEAAKSVERAGAQQSPVPVMTIFFLAVLLMSVIMQMIWHLVMLSWRGF